MKDYAAFKAGFGICYRPEAEDSEYSRQDFLEIAKGNERLAIALFELVEWQHPETLFEEWVIEGEIDEQGNYLNTSL